MEDKRERKEIEREKETEREQNEYKENEEMLNVMKTY